MLLFAALLYVSNILERKESVVKYGPLMKAEQDYDVLFVVNNDSAVTKPEIASLQIKDKKPGSFCFCKEFRTAVACSHILVAIVSTDFKCLEYILAGIVNSFAPDNVDCVMRL